MIYPANFEQKIGFDRLREQIAAMCSMQAGRRLIEAEKFSISREDIEFKQDIADEMRVMLMLDPNAPRDEYPDMEGIIEKIGVEGAFLDCEQVATLRRALTAVGSMVGFITSRNESQYPRLRKRSERVCVFPDVIRRINQLIDDEANVKDGASQDLLYIRRSIREHEGQVSKRLQQVLSNAKRAGIVDADAMISIREGRAVIPVSAANKRKLNGFVHDESATGRTFYIEPVEVVELNNQLKELEYAERREIVRLLTEFTEELRPDAEPIAQAGEYLAEMDAIRAKARWAIENKAGKPIVSTDDRLVLRGAFHPLLAQTLRREQKELVPLDMQLDKSKHILVISGPNAGGKSVCLKTTGIVQYMFQCGFPVTATETSELPIFESICIDIGDEQSMDNDLSTYSSHLHNMKNMLQAASNKTLVLIDEYGSGTEPVIGGAIAESILERLLERGCYGVITTHYS
ncbi:MAG: endonuclease MutS2, partial [Alistipes sp.]|nr:endonuclease MutS2 [Alistipes sp.]